MATIVSRERPGSARKNARGRRGTQHSTAEAPKTSIGLKEGLPGKAKIQFKGKGINLLPPGLPLPVPVTVQVKNTAGACWDAVYPSADTNDGVQFKAKGD